MGILSIFKSQEEKFWEWFKENEIRLFNFENEHEKVFDILSDKLNKINKDLTFEFGPDQEGKREFVISAGGIRSAFPAVEKLIRIAPAMDKWIFIKYRPRRNPVNDLSFGGKSVKSSEVFYRFFDDKDEDRIGVMLFIDGYTENEKDIWGQIGFLLLDEALGEYDVEIKIGAIVFEPTNSKYFENVKPLNEMASELDEYFCK